MKRATKIAAGAAALMMMAGSAFAADVPQVVAPVAPPPPPVATFDWGGIYVGGGVLFPVGIGFEGHAGYNIVRGNLVVSLEGQVRYLLGSPWPFDVGGEVHLGFAVGERLLVYGLGAVNYTLGGPPFPPLYWNAGGGAALAIGNSISIYAEGLVFGGFPGCCGFGVQVGVNFHP